MLKAVLGAMKVVEASDLGRELLRSKSSARWSCFARFVKEKLLPEVWGNNFRPVFLGELAVSISDRYGLRFPVWCPYYELDITADEQYCRALGFHLKTICLVPQYEPCKVRQAEIEGRSDLPIAIYLPKKRK